jgi:hypothetical protein
MLTGQFCKIDLSDGNQTFMPFVRASLKNGNHNSVEMDALIDTGACVNLISIRSVKTALGITPDDARQGRKLSISPVGKNELFAYGFQVDITLRASTNNSSKQFILSNSSIYVVDAELPTSWQMLIGQFHGFEERTLLHLNRQKKRFWQIQD